MKVDLNDVNFNELARCTDDFNGAQMKAVAVEAGMTIHTSPVYIGETSTY